MIPPTQLQSHQPQISNFKPPFPPKATAVKPFTVIILINPTFTPIIRLKQSIPTSPLIATRTKPSHSNSSQLFTLPQIKTMYPSPQQWTTVSRVEPAEKGKRNS